MFIPLLIPFLLAIFLSVNMGGSGSVPAFSALYNAKIIRPVLIPGLFGLMVLLGALTCGRQTIQTMSTGIISHGYMTYTVTSIVLFSIAVSLLIANILSIPQSASQSAVMAIAAPAIYFDALDSSKLFTVILPAWIILPVVAFIVAYLSGRFIYKPLRIMGLTLGKQVREHFALRTLLVATSLYTAFAIGANNVANAAGPLSAMASIQLGASPQHSVHVMMIAVLVIAPSFGIGSSLFMHNMAVGSSQQQSLFGPVEAIIIAITSASLLLVASIGGGIPVSAIQINAASIVGIGVAKLGLNNILRKTNIHSYWPMWIIAPASAFCMSLALVHLAQILGFIAYR